jgi:regulator of nucleoside diphosphate kinase
MSIRDSNLPIASPLTKITLTSYHINSGCQFRPQLAGFNSPTDTLGRELVRASIVEPSELPRQVVSMNSTVWFRDLDTEEIDRSTLVFPHEADVNRHRISVLARIGSALLGYRLRDIVEWRVPLGQRRLEITKVSQPKAARSPERAEILV